MIQVNKNILSKFGLFKGLSPEQYERISKLVRTRNYKKGDTIIKEGEIGGELFFLISGEIEINKKLTLLNSEGANQTDKSLVRLKDSDNVFFGEMSIFDSGERSATIIACSDVTVGILTREQILLLGQQDPELGYKLFFNIGHTLAINLRRADRDILKLTTAFVLALEKK